MQKMTQILCVNDTYVNNGGKGSSWLIKFLMFRFWYELKLVQRFQICYIQQHEGRSKMYDPISDFRFVTHLLLFY